MEKLSKYKKQIVTFITIFLLVTYGIFPALTAANTILNIIGGIGALLFLVWGGLELYTYITSDSKPLEEVKAEPKVKKKPTPKVKKIKLKEK
jgi:hypothetical protein